MLNRRLLKDIVVWVVPVIGGIATFFSFMLVAVASPFTTVTRTVDGQGLVPSLQNPYMVAHPPMLYLGYVGLSIPFAFAAGAMLSGHTDERWIVATRRWTLAAWMFLGFGQILGAHWAYVEVGWGGYYAWDPVENAALMPWLAATAFLHSVMVEERKGMLRVWDMVLVALAFELSVFGTFLTRSGMGAAGSGGGSNTYAISPCIASSSPLSASSPTRTGVTSRSPQHHVGEAEGVEGTAEAGGDLLAEERARAVDEALAAVRVDCGSGEDSEQDDAEQPADAVHAPDVEGVVPAQPVLELDRVVADERPPRCRSRPRHRSGQSRPPA